MSSVTPLGEYSRPLGARGSRSTLEAPERAGHHALAILSSWWVARVTKADVPDGWRDFNRVFPTAANLIGDVTAAPVAAAPTSESLGNMYVCGLDPAIRAAHGRHYTPSGLAKLVWADCARNLQSVARDTGLVLDPACGSGALLLPVVRQRVRAALKSGASYGDVAGSITGWDLDDAAVLIANVVLHAELLPLIARDGVGPDQSRLPCRVSDGLAIDSSRFDAVVMNPPYGRVRLDDRERNRFAHAVYRVTAENGSQSTLRIREQPGCSTPGWREKRITEHVSDAFHLVRRSDATGSTMFGEVFRPIPEQHKCGLNVF
jgi:adenine-specific DNA-methyltransferase